MPATKPAAARHAPGGWDWWQKASSFAPCAPGRPALSRRQRLAWGQGAANKACIEPSEKGGRGAAAEARGCARRQRMRSRGDHRQGIVAARIRGGMGAASATFAHDQPASDQISLIDRSFNLQAGNQPNTAAPRSARGSRRRTSHRSRRCLRGGQHELSLGGAFQLLLFFFRIRNASSSLLPRLRRSQAGHRQACALT